MFGNENERIIKQLKTIWENEHAEEMTEAYNDIVGVLSKLDMYSANILVNLLWLQAVQKSYLGTVGKITEKNGVVING